MTEDTKTPEPKDQGVSLTEYNKVREQMQNWQAKATDFEKRYANIDPEEYSAIKGEIEILRKDAAKGDDNKIEELLATTKAEVKKQYDTKLTELESSLNSTSRELKRHRVVNSSLSKAAQKFNEDGLELIEMKIDQFCDFEDGKIVVKDEEGNKRLGADPRVDMSIDEYLEELAEKYPSIAKPQGSGGSRQAGMKKPDNVSESMTVSLDKYTRMSNQERMEKLSPKERLALSQQALKQVSGR